METRNILDANIDDLSEEELEACLAELDQSIAESQSSIKELDQATAKTQSKKKELDERCENLSKNIEKRDQEIKVHKENIVMIDARMKKRDDEYKQGIHEIFKPLYTGEVYQIDLSKLIQQKGATSAPEKHTPPSPEHGSVSSGGSSTPPSKASHGDGHSRKFSSLSLSGRSDSDSGDEKPSIGQPLKEEKTARLFEKNLQQSMPATASKAPAPQPKGLLAKLGINRKPQQQQLPATPGVAPVVAQRVGR